MEELKKALKKQLKSLEVKNERYAILHMGKAQMEGRYAFVRIGYNYGSGWVDKSDEVEAEFAKILDDNGCKVAGRDGWNIIITY